MTNINLKKINNFLSFTLLGLSLYIILFPIIPEVNYFFYHLQNKNSHIKFPERVEQLSKSEITINDLNIRSEDLEKTNLLFIPSIGVRGKITEGKDTSALANGFWRRPETSTPPNGSNTVITGHRFMYMSGPLTFYNLDKVKIGDEILIYWQGKRFEYNVFNILEVSPQSPEIEAASNTPILTLYTCTPLWTAEKRLIVQANLIEKK